MKIEKYDLYEFSIRKYKEVVGDTHYNGWEYVIYDSKHEPVEENIIRESCEWFDTEQQARYAAIGHISLLVNGEE